ncbi:hypothetical protein [Kitasatospora sp. NPDC101183]|uniref:hypothetical protein n=1 Tax=Kitasatospora sp. NPDC101183 TaxID=3364100 RepID=UPI0038285FB0
MPQTISAPALAGLGGSIPSPTRVTTWQESLVSVLLLVSLLAALIVLLLKGFRLQDAFSALATGGLLAAELRRRLLA